MKKAFFVSDLHGNEEKYKKLFSALVVEKPEVLFMGGDLLSRSYLYKNYIDDFLAANFIQIKYQLKDAYPKIFIVLGNDDARSEENQIIKYSTKGLWHYIHFTHTKLGNKNIYGYNFTPPSPFFLKDWEKYDISRFVEPGCISPEEGKRTVEISEREKKFSTIKEDLDLLSKEDDFTNSIYLFHSPPYQTNLDRAALDGRMIDGVPVDVNVGSIAIRKFIEKNQPLLTLHGHIHESARITGSWRDKIGKTHCYSAAHNGSELAIIKFDLDEPAEAERVLI